MQTFKIEKNDTQCVVTWRHIVSGYSFLLICLVLWMVACVLLVNEVFVKQKFIMLVLALPAWGGWIVCFKLVVDMLFGKTKFVLDGTGLQSTWTCLFFKHEKRIDFADLHRFEKIVNQEEAEDSGQRLYYFRVVGRENNINYFISWDEKELDDLCEQLNAFLETLKAASSVDAA